MVEVPTNQKISDCGANMEQLEVLIHTPSGRKGWEIVFHLFSLPSFITL
jgi:hypothetical protein